MPVHYAVRHSKRVREPNSELLGDLLVRALDGPPPAKPFVPLDGAARACEVFYETLSGVRAS